MEQVEVAKYRPQWFQNPRVYIVTLVITALAMLSVLQGLWTTGSLLLVIQAFLFILAFRRPAWAVAALLVGQFTTSNYYLTLGSVNISIRLFWTILAVLVVIPLLRKNGAIKIGRKARSIIIPTVIFFVLTTVANAVNLDTASTYQYLRTGLSSLAIVFFIPAVVNNEKDLRLLAVVTMVTCFASSIAAVLQHYQHLGMPVFTVTGSDIIPYNRTMGLSIGPVHLAYQLPVVILPMMAIYFTKGVSKGSRVVLIILGLVMLLGLYFTYTRSGIYSLVPGLLIMILFLSGQRKKELLIIFIVLVAGFLVYTNLMGNRYTKGFSDESSAAGRLVLWQAGVMIALDNPVFGIGEGRFMQVSQAYSSEVEQSSVAGANEALGVQETHNDFIRVWLSFGTPALLVYLLLFVITFRFLYRGFKQSSSPFLKGMALGCFAALLSYIVNAFLHNLMDSSPIFWILAGFSLAILKLNEASQPVTGEAQVVKTPAVQTLPDTSTTEP
jgi:O-antigen ligase